MCFWLSQNPINPKGVAGAALGLSQQVYFFAPLSYFFLPRRPWSRISYWTHQVTYLQLDVFYLPHFSPAASVAAAGANYSLSKKEGVQNADLALYVCVCVSMRVHGSASTNCDNSHPEAGVLWGDSQEITPCTRIIPSSLSLLSCPLPHQLPPLHLTQLLLHYMPSKCYSGPLFEKPFHFSLLSVSCDNGLLSLRMVSSVIHIQRNTCWPSATSDRGCNFDRRNVKLNCTARLLLARRRPVLCWMLTLSSHYKLDLKQWHHCMSEGNSSLWCWLSNQFISVLVVKSEAQLPRFFTVILALFRLEPRKVWQSSVVCYKEIIYMIAQCFEEDESQGSGIESYHILLASECRSRFRFPSCCVCFFLEVQIFQERHTEAHILEYTTGSDLWDEYFEYWTNHWPTCCFRYDSVCDSPASADTE